MNSKAGRPKAVNREHLCTEKISFSVPPLIKNAYSETAHLFRMKESEFYRTILGLMMSDVLKNQKVKEIIKQNTPPVNDADFENGYSEMLSLIDSMISQKAINTFRKIHQNRINEIKLGKFQAA